MRFDILAWLGSVALICGALYFQYVQGLEPCVLCIYQRVPHIAVIILGALAIWKFPQAYPLMGLIILAGVGIAGFHTGVEQGWWEGLTSCSGRADSLMDALGKAPAKCDEIAWSFLGLSMATWNGICSLIIAVFWFKAKR